MISLKGSGYYPADCVDRGLYPKVSLASRRTDRSAAWRLMVESRDRYRHYPGWLHKFTLPETNMAPENGWLEY